MEKNDGNTTKKLIADAAMNLMKTKGLKKITVREIAEAANINRQTFYYHFEDIFHLVQWIYREDMMALFNNKGGKALWQEGLFMLLQYLEENRSAGLCILNSLSRKELRALFYDDIVKLMDVASDSISQSITSMAKDSSPEYDHFLVFFYSISFATMIEYWILGEIPMSAQELIRLVDRMIQDQITGVIYNSLK